MEIGARLKKIIEEKQTNVNELANRARVAPSTLYSIIKRDSTKVDINVLVRVADVLGVPIEYFSEKSEIVIPDRNATFVDRIQYLCKARGVSTEKLCQLTNIDINIIGKYENDGTDHMTLDDIKSLAIALNTTIEYLMGWSNDPNRTIAVLDDPEIRIAARNSDLNRNTVLQNTLKEVINAFLANNPKKV